MTKNPFEISEDKPGKGHDHFYDKRKKEDRISGLRYAIEQVEDRIKNDPNRPPGAFEEQLESLRAQLEEAIKNR